MSNFSTCTFLNRSLSRVFRILGAVSPSLAFFSIKKCKFDSSCSILLIISEESLLLLSSRFPGRLFGVYYSAKLLAINFTLENSSFISLFLVGAKDLHVLLGRYQTTLELVELSLPYIFLLESVDLALGELVLLNLRVLKLFMLRKACNFCFYTVVFKTWAISSAPSH